MYASIDFWKFALAAGIVALPLVVIKDKWAWRYVLLILLMFVVINFRGLQSFTNFVRREISGG